MILLEVAVNLFTRTWFRIRSVTSARQACRKIAVLSLIRSQRQLACEGLYNDCFESDEEQIKGYGKVIKNTEIFSTKYGKHILEVGSPGHFIYIDTLRPRQNGRRFADDTFKRIFLN